MESYVMPPIFLARRIHEASAYLAKYVTNWQFTSQMLGISHGLPHHHSCLSQSVVLFNRVSTSFFNKSSMYFCCEVKIPPLDKILLFQKIVKPVLDHQYALVTIGVKAIWVQPTMYWEVQQVVESLLIRIES